MSLVSTFVDAFKKAAGKQPTKPDVDMKSLGPLGSVPESASGSFDPLRPTPESDSGQGIDRGDVSVPRIGLRRRPERVERPAGRFWH